MLQSGGAQTVSSLMFAVPVLLGAFAGAPLLSRELDSGTFRFAWTQGAGRTRWAVSTLVVPALAADGGDRGVHRDLLLVLPAVPGPRPGQRDAAAVVRAARGGVRRLDAARLRARRVPRRRLPAHRARRWWSRWSLYIVLAMATATAIRPHYATPVTVAGWTSATNSSGWVISELEKAPNGQRAEPGRPVPATSRRLPSSVQNSANSERVHQLADQARLHRVDQPAARLAVLAVPAHRGRLAATALSAALIGATVWLVRRRSA